MMHLQQTELIKTAIKRRYTEAEAIAAFQRLNDEYSMGNDAVFMVSVAAAHAEVRRRADDCLRRQGIDGAWRTERAMRLASGDPVNIGQNCAFTPDALIADDAMGYLLRSESSVMNLIAVVMFSPSQCLRLRAENELRKVLPDDEYRLVAKISDTYEGRLRAGFGAEAILAAANKPDKKPADQAVPNDGHAAPAQERQPMTRQLGSHGCIVAVILNSRARQCYGSSAAAFSCDGSSRQASPTDREKACQPPPDDLVSIKKAIASDVWNQIGPTSSGSVGHCSRNQELPHRADNQRFFHQITATASMIGPGPTASLMRCGGQAEPNRQAQLGRQTAPESSPCADHDDGTLSLDCLIKCSDIAALALLIRCGPQLVSLSQLESLRDSRWFRRLEITASLPRDLKALSEKLRW
jgi:hypothetical protein